VTARPGPALLAGVITALDVVREHVVILDARGRIVHANLAWQRFALDNGDETTDWTGVDYLAASSEPCVSAGIEDPITDGVREVVEGRRERFEHEYDCHAPDELRWFRLTAVRVTLPGIAAIVTHADITASRRAERALEHHATHDRVTGLLNRAALEQEIGQMLREGQDVSVVVVRFSDATQPPGLVDDDDLVGAASRTRELFPPPATVGRWGPRAFVVAMGGVPEEALSVTAEVLADTFERLPRSLAASVRSQRLPDVAALARLDVHEDRRLSVEPG
jgi:GGDEF domain-containing protein